jgi:hypothetical protein
VLLHQIDDRGSGAGTRAGLARKVAIARAVVLALVAVGLYQPT